MKIVDKRITVFVEPEVGSLGHYMREKYTDGTFNWFAPIPAGWWLVDDTKAAKLETEYKVSKYKIVPTREQ